MDVEERLKLLETEFQATREELRQILLDLRTYLMEAQTPFQSGGQPTKHMSQAASEMEKGVEPDGSR